jgi:predicted secreted Zn-dependent protease
MFKIRSKTATAGILAAVFVFVPPVMAEQNINTTIINYDITGTSGKELKRQMKERGPKGFWAHTRWNVRWSSECIVQLEITYTYPRLTDSNRIPLPVRKRFSAMMEILTQHEQEHGQHGINAAREIKAANCENAKAIVNKWALEDKIYDTETRHGVDQGVYLRD